jgi:dienelactone hydrolase
MIGSPPAWSGSYVLPASAAPVTIAVQVHARTATVVLGPGHSSATDVRFQVHGKHIRFRFPGLPHDLVFDGTVRRGRLSGTVSQGSLRGRFSLRRGLARIVSLLGVYRTGRGKGAAVLEADGLPPFLVELPSGRIHGIGKSLTVGHLLGDQSGNGSLAVDATGFSWTGTHYTRLALRQREVRLGPIAATLSLPTGAGPFPAVAMVHGSGPRTRDEFDIFSAYLELKGFAVLADDKRGTGESGGRYPGEAATASAINLLARDAQTETHFLAHLPRIDPKRVGLFGDSQAGWIIPLAAKRDQAVHWGLLNSGPTTTVGETDYWGQLAGESLSPPSGTWKKMLAQVRAAGPSGFNPIRDLRHLAIPIHWMYGSDDRNVPTKLCLERLRALSREHDYSWNVFPTTHTPLILPTGLISSLPQSPGFEHGFLPAIGAWLRRERILR